MKIPGIFFRVNYENDVLYVGNHVDVHKGAGPPTHVDACGQMGGWDQNPDFFVDVING